MIRMISSFNCYLTKSFAWLSFSSYLFTHACLIQRFDIPSKLDFRCLYRQTWLFLTLKGNVQSCLHNEEAIKKCQKAKWFLWLQKKENPMRERRWGRIEWLQAYFPSNDRKEKRILEASQPDVHFRSFVWITGFYAWYRSDWIQEQE